MSKFYNFQSEECRLNYTFYKEKADISSTKSIFGTKNQRSVLFDTLIGKNTPLLSFTK